jgi:hypothetical protein
MTQPTIAHEVAEQEINDWLESKKILPDTIEDNEASKKVLISAMMYGRLKYNSEDNSLTQTLAFPVGDIKELRYRSRINDNFVQKYMKGAPQNDADARVNGYLAAMTETGRGIISGLDFVDKKVANAIGAFFF